MDSQRIQHHHQQAKNTLEQAEIAARYGLSKWIFRRGQAYVTGRVLEIGEGEGLIAKYCRRENIPVEVLPVNLGNESFNEIYKDLLGAFNVVYMLHSGQELFNSNLVVNNSTMLLKQEGYLIALLPCKIALYDGLDQGLEDWKTSNRRYIRARVGTCFEIIKVRYFEVGVDMPPVVSPRNGYEERVRSFEKIDDYDFMSSGLFVLAIMKKK